MPDGRSSGGGLNAGGEYLRRDDLPAATATFFKSVCFFEYVRKTHPEPFYFSFYPLDFERQKSNQELVEQSWASFEEVEQEQQAALLFVD